MNQSLTIKEIQAFADKSPVPFVGGIIQSLGEFQTGSDDSGPWSLQELVIADATGALTVRVGNHEEIAPARLENHSPIWFVAIKKPNGGLTGLRIQEEENQTGKVRLLAVARSALILTQTEWEAMSRPACANPPQPPPQAAPAPQPPPQAPPMTQQRATAEPPHTSEAPKPAMRVSELRYERTVNTGNYCSEKMGITLALEPGTRAVDAVEAAKTFLTKHLPKEAVPVKARVLD